jgi:hypothetical protein
MQTSWKAGAGALMAAAFTAVSFAACPPATTAKDSLLTLKRAEWNVTDDAQRQSIALALLDCLAEPDPVLRDDLAFDALAHWMRARQLAPETLQSMRAALLPQLRPEAADAAGFRQPFAALALAEVARVDRLQPFLSSAQRAELVAAGTAYLASVRDYRGFDATDGWRHGIAHGADLLLQLTLNAAVDRGQIDRILAAIASQVMPPDAHFYIYGEGDRLMAPVFYAGRRGLLGVEDWHTWFVALAAKRALPQVPTQASLADKHNLASFLLPLYASLRESGDAQLQARMLPGVAAALKTLD